MGKLNSKKVVVWSSDPAPPGGPVCTVATTGMANAALMARMTTPWIRWSEPTPTFQVRRFRKRARSASSVGVSGLMAVDMPATYGVESTPP